MNQEALDTARDIILQQYPNCDAAVLAGSVVRGQETPTSDLDLVIIDNNIMSSYRESFIENGWPVEAFVHNERSYQQFVEDDLKRARPSLPWMIAEGIVLKDTGILNALKEQAATQLEDGPEQWTVSTIDFKRYFITDGLDDFTGSGERAEQIFIAGSLAELLAEFVLRINGQWIGTSKWTVRALRNWDSEFADRFVDSFDRFYGTGEKQAIINLADEILKPYGGRLFDGFSAGKNDRRDSHER